MNHVRTLYGLALGTVLLTFAASGCARDEAPEAGTPPPSEVEIRIRDLEFDAPSEIPSGWTTFVMRNGSPMTHFALIERLPEGITLDDHQKQVAPVFQEGLELLVAGRTDEAMARFGELPEWFARLEFLGGPGLLAPGHTSRTTVHLEPGQYLLECYVKTDGVFHSYNPDPEAYGMVHAFTVTGAMNDAPEPSASLSIHLASDGGLQVSGTPTPGEHTVSVHFGDQKVYGNFVGHDVHLARLTDDSDLEALEAWMDWRRADGLETPAPVEFLGGLNEMPAGSTGYFSVDLEPGRYVWVAEVPDASSEGMLQVFTVP